MGRQTQTYRKGFVFYILLLLAANVFMASDSVQITSNRNLNDDLGGYIHPPGPASTIEIVLDINNVTQVRNFTDNYMDWVFDIVPMVGATVSVVANNTEIFAKGYGLANIESSTPVNGNTSLFQVASISKLFVWTSLMQLWEKGLIDLDEDINTYLEGFQVPATFEAPITVQHLMDHTSGWDNNWAHNAGSENLEHFCEVDMPRRIRHPGEYSVYSTYEANIAGLIVEYVSNISYPTYVQEYILDPLGMNHSTYYPAHDEELNPLVVTGYEILESEVETTYVPHFIDHHDALPAGSLATTADDMAKFMSAILQNGTYNGETILENATTQKMLSISYTDDPHVLGWANGWTEARMHGYQLFGHGGISFWMRTHAFVCPEEDFGVFISLNTPNGFLVTWNFLYKFMNAFFPDNTSPDPTATAHQDYASRAQNFDGIYIDSERPHKQFMKMIEFYGSLYTIQIEATGTGYIDIVNDYTDQFFVETEENVFYPIDENGTIYTNESPIVFLVNEEGTILHLIYGNSGFGYDFVPWYQTPSVNQIALFTAVGLIFLFGIAEIFILRKYLKSAKEKPPADAAKVIFGRNSTSLMMIINSFFICITVGLLFLLMPGIMERLMDWEVYFPSLYIMLTLPVLSAILSGGLVIKEVSDFIRREKIRWKISRIIYFVGYTAILALFFTILNYWRVLGYNL